MKKNIAVKLFVITAIFFTIFISIQLLFQSVFFQNFYISRKTKNLKANTESFSREYVKNIGNMDNTLSNIKNFEENNNAKIVILESNGLLSYITDYKDEAKDTNRVKVIQGIIRQWTSDPKAFIDMQKKGETVTYIFNDKYYNIQNIVTIVPIVFNDIPAKVIFAVSSLQPVNEAASVMKEFYIYIYIAALFLILVLAFIYSKMISKPLVNLNKTASKMAQMDFSEKCHVDSEDEIGSLAKTLNFLSDNLSMSLNSLQESNEKLKEDIEKEKKLEVMRKEFVAAVSHELKTPISLIEGYAEGIKDNVVEEEDKDYYVDVIIDEAKKMGSLVAEMLELSKLESGSFKIETDTFLIDRTINETIKRLEGINRVSEDCKIKIEKSIDKDIRVIGDESKIEEVITNFLTNAIRHTEPGGNIYVSTSIREGEVLVEVENEGRNIPEDELDKIWDKFYKIDKSRNRNLGGTGLGLTIVKNLLELHHSNFGAVNTEKGVKFYFSLKYVI